MRAALLGMSSGGKIKLNLVTRKSRSKRCKFYMNWIESDCLWRALVGWGRGELLFWVINFMKLVNNSLFALIIYLHTKSNKNRVRERLRHNDIKLTFSSFFICSNIIRKFNFDFHISRNFSSFTDHREKLCVGILNAIE